ncbi:putative T6SS immunity periplasmic lipoprotein [Pantoea sp. FN0305]|uniref:putative T6SS immunity periplasmic lipoprotein n=1 Tax=Pantoea sp. FN0305 TaxID=3418559 RepID=UPI003CF8A809
MNIKVLYLGLAIFLSGCHLERPFYHPLPVKVEQGRLCFTAPEENNHNIILKVDTPYISLHNGDSWETVILSEEATQGQKVIAGECIFWNEIKWLPGEYDVAVKIKKESSLEKRYSTHFILGKNEQGHLFLEK